MKRERAINAVNSLSQEFNLEELIEKLIFAEKVDLGLMQLQEGKIVSHDKVKELVKKW